MIVTAHPTSSSAAAIARAPAGPTLELREARRLRDGLATLLGAERTAAADFLLALTDFDRCRGWEPLGHASLFAFLTAELHLSRSAAFWRLSAARLLQRFPEVIEPLRDGRLCLSTTAELAKVLTGENLADVLPRYYRLSAREAAEVTAALQPRALPPLRTVVTGLEPARTPRPVPTPPEASAPPLALALAPAGTRTDGAVLTSEPDPQYARIALPRDDVEPLTADLRRLHVTVSRHFLKKLDAARDGLSHALPGATAEQALEAALDLLLDRQARARGQVKRPRTVVPTSPAPAEADQGAPRRPEPEGSATEPLHRRTGPREAIPAAVRRVVWERDQGRCAWPLDSGGCCGSTHRLELDHVVPWAQGGAATADNLRVTCHHHNALAARQFFGARCADRYAGARASASGSG